MNLASSGLVYLTVHLSCMATESYYYLSNQPHNKPTQISNQKINNAINLLRTAEDRG